MKKIKVTIDGVKYKLKIMQDGNPESPREWDNVTRMICFHNRYRIGDKHDLKSSQFNNWGEMEKYLIRKHRPLAIKPLYLYDHSIQSISTTSFVGRAHHAEWDSGRIGFVLVDRGDAIMEWGKKRITKKLREWADRMIEAEVKTYDQFLQGDTYGFSLKTIQADGTVQRDSCFGFYGDDIYTNGISEHLPEELIAHLKSVNF